LEKLSTTGSVDDDKKENESDKKKSEDDKKESEDEIDMNNLQNLTSITPEQAKKIVDNTNGPLYLD
jgi:hypothetical protein